MAADTSQSRPAEDRNWGKLAFLPPPAIKRDSLPVLIRDMAKAEQCIWMPHEQYSRDFAPESGLALLCVTASNGMRWFLPHTADLRRPNPFLAFYVRAWQCGFEVLRLKNSKQFEDPVLRNTYRFMWFFFRRARKFQEFITRSFNSASELVIKKGSRGSKSLPGILPWIGSQQTGTDNFPQSANELIALGEGLARAWGVQRVSRARMMQFGLAAVAKLLKSEACGDQEVGSLVRAVFFDLPSPPEEYSAKIQLDVEGLLLDTVEPWFMNESMPQEVFDELFWGRSNTLLKQVASQCSSAVDLAVVRYALLDLCWRAFTYIGQCVEAIMLEVAKALPNPLSAPERRAFELLYFPQPFFAGRPLVFLDERLALVSPLLDEMVEGPNDPNPIRAFHNFLHLYVAMVDARKAADREAKAPKLLSTGAIDANEITIFPPILSKEDELYVAEILDRVRIACGVTCDCLRPKWTAQLKDFKSKGALIEFCPQCHQGMPIEKRVPTKVIKRAALN